MEKHSSELQAEYHEDIEKNRTISDQGLEYLRTHNIVAVSSELDTEEKLGSFQELFVTKKSSGKERGFTYNEGYNPILNHNMVDPSRINDFINSCAENKLYFQKKVDFPTMPKKELEKVLDSYGNPLAHGSHIMDAVGGYGLISPGEKTPAAALISYGYGETKAAVSRAMYKIDRGQEELPELDDDFATIYNAYTDLVPRFATLLARDKDWKMEQLDTFLVKELGPEKAKWLYDNLSFANRDNMINREKLDEIAGRILKQPMTEEDKTTILYITSRIREGFEVIDRYMKTMVSYENKTVPNN